MMKEVLRPRRTPVMRVTSQFETVFAVKLQLQRTVSSLQSNVLRAMFVYTGCPPESHVGRSLKSEAIVHVAVFASQGRAVQDLLY